jgi:hypothetical protein
MMIALKTSSQTKQTSIGYKYSLIRARSECFNLLENIFYSETIKVCGMLTHVLRAYNNIFKIKNLYLIIKTNFIFKNI